MANKAQLSDDLLLDPEIQYLVIRENLVPAGGHPAILRAPTYAGKNKQEPACLVFDLPPDGSGVRKKSVILDRNASYVNRIEDRFLQDPRYRKLVREIIVDVPQENKTVNVLEMPFRMGDGTFMATNLFEYPIKGILDRMEKRDARGFVDMAKDFPHTVVFGAWFSRTHPRLKLPRIVNPQIQAFNIEQVPGGASMHPPIGHGELLVDPDTGKPFPAATADQSDPLSVQGLNDYSSTTTYTGTIQTIPDTEILLTVKLSMIHLRRYLGYPDSRGNYDPEVLKAVRYIFGLAVLSATMPVELHLRQDCELTTEGAQEVSLVSRSRGHVPIEGGLDHEAAYVYTEKAMKALGVSSEPLRGLYDPKKLGQWVSDEKKRRSGKKAKNANGHTEEVGQDDVDGGDADEPKSSKKTASRKKR